MGYKATYPEEVINAHRAFIARRRATRPGEEYPGSQRRGMGRVPRPLRAPQGRIGDCGRAWWQAASTSTAASGAPCSALTQLSGRGWEDDPRQPDRPHRRSRTRRLGRRSRGPQDQPRRGAPQARPAGAAGPPRAATVHLGMPGPGRYRRPRPRRAGAAQPARGAVMTPAAVTAALVHDLAAGSHAEGASTPWAWKPSSNTTTASCSLPSPARTSPMKPGSCPPGRYCPARPSPTPCTPPSRPSG